MLAPDPPNGGAVTYVPYQYVTPALSRATHRRIPHEWFRCYVRVDGRRRCVRFTR